METCKSQGFSSLFAANKDSRSKDQRTLQRRREDRLYREDEKTRRPADAKTDATSRERQTTDSSSSSSARCSCGALFSENARFCEVCGAPHPSAARAEKRAKDPSELRNRCTSATRAPSPALQRAAVQAAQGQHSLSSSRSTDKVSQGCTGCSMM